MDVLHAVRERRSINYFDSSRTVPEDILQSLIETANLAPSSMNLQPWRVLVVNTPERKAVLKQCAFNQPKVAEASVMLVMIADPGAVEANLGRVLDSWVNLLYIKPEAAETYRGMVSSLYEARDTEKRKMFAVKNTALFAMNLMIAARGFELETHPMDGFDEAAVKREFGIPDNCVIPMLIAVGYLKPGITLLPRAFRRKTEEFVSVNHYTTRK
ncbi:MAG TPA: nitroreductase family protein [Dissulfurispiraceae bacterium]|nr:nitroreductase family protein [Dissulfurispiraceae bacterium]